jgi:uncharacterized HhH-GPD family protein
MPLRLSGDSVADALLSKDPLALLIGMVLDQQVPLEWAFAAPAELKRRLGGRLDVAAMAAMSEEDLVAVFLERPALHRYPASMARRVHELCRLIVDDYGSSASNVWSGAASGTELLGRLKKLPGFGDQKARIFLALLGKQLNVRPDGWDSVSTPYGEPGSFRSVADIVDADSLDRVRMTKQAAKQAAKEAAAKAPAKKVAAKKVAGKSPAKKAVAKKTVAKKAAPRTGRATKKSS